MDQLQIQDRFIRQRSAAAKRQGVPLTVCLNEMLEAYRTGKET